MTLVKGGLVQSVRVYENILDPDTDHLEMIDVPGVSSIADFVLVQGSYTFKEFDTFRLLGASPVQRWTYTGGDKTNVVSYAGPVVEGTSGLSTRIQSIIPSALNITIVHDEALYFETTIIDDVAGTTLDDITGLTETSAGSGTLKVNLNNGRPFSFGAALSGAIVRGPFNPSNPDGFYTLDYELKAGTLHLTWSESALIKP